MTLLADRVEEAAVIAGEEELDDSHLAASAERSTETLCLGRSFEDRLDWLENQARQRAEQDRTDWLALAGWSVLSAISVATVIVLMVI